MLNAALNVRLMTPKFLSAAQIEEFLSRGHIVLRNCFPREVADEWVAKSFTRLGYDQDDPSTWVEKRIHMGGTETVAVRDFAPDAFAAICDLLGGEDRIQGGVHWSDGFIWNLGIGADEPWQPPSPAARGWHKDGDFFRHFLDSPEQGLLVIVVWTEIKPRGGGTFLACDSIAPVARTLAQHSEGILPNEMGSLFHEWINQCLDFKETIASPGDVVLLHPYMLHTVSQNHLGVPRAITNPPVHLREPMNFNRESPEDFSPVELAVLRALGVERLDFEPSVPRERVVPERVRIQQQRLEEERARLAKAA